MAPPNITKEQVLELLKKENVVGVGRGAKVTKDIDDDCIVVLVTEKKPLLELESQNIVPRSINGLAIDVVEVGVIKIQDRTERMRPAVGGISIGHKDITAGTFGCIVYRDNQPYILGNNHVLANSNKAKVGDPIFQPGAYDGGTPADTIATLEQYVEVKFEEEPPKCPIANSLLDFFNFLTKTVKPDYRWHLTKQTSHINYVDAAIGKPLSKELIKDEILEIGSIKGVAKAELNMQVQKSGRTTGHTTGTIVVVDATIRVQYGEGKVALFEEQILAGPMSKGGDSGSAVLDMNNNLVGLLFAGSNLTTVINPIQRVLELLKVTR